MPDTGSSSWPTDDVLELPSSESTTSPLSAGDGNRTFLGWLQAVTGELRKLYQYFHGTGLAADLNFGGHKGTNGATPTAGTDVAIKSYVDAVAQGLSVKPSVKGASTTNHSVSAFSGSTIDGGSVSLSVGDRILLKDQSTPSENGPWVFQGAGSALTRPTDFAHGAQEAGAFVFVESGTANAGAGYVLASTSIVVDTTAQTWTQFSGAGEVIAGTGMTKSGNTLNVVANADATIVANADDIKVGTLIAGNVPSGLITSAMVADGTLVNADVNASAAIVRSKLDFGSGLVNTDIAAAAAIAYSKLNLTGGILNADVNAAAAIAYSKLTLTGSVTDADVAAANKDGAAGTASMRTLGTGATQAAQGSLAEYLAHKDVASGYMGLDSGGKGNSPPKAHAASHAVGGTDAVNRVAGNVPFVSGNALVTWASMPSAATEFPNAGRLRAKADLTYATQVRLVVTVVTASTSANTPVLLIYYSTTGSGGWTVIDSAAGNTGAPASIASNALAVYSSPWVTLDPAAQADVWLALYGKGGDASASPSISQAIMQVR